MSYEFGVLHGDGIGFEITSSTVKVLKTLNTIYDLSIEFESLPMGWEGINNYNHPMPNITKEKLEKKDCWIMGPHDSASYPNEYKAYRNPSGELRFHFDLFANIRPTKTLPSIHSNIVQNADLVIFRENTEGFYSDRNMVVGSGEWKITEDIVISAGVFTRKAISRIAREAFEMAMKRSKKVTIVHKANVLNLGMGLFKEVCLEISKEFPEVTVDDYHIDAMAALLVRNIEKFDIIITENMYGDILSDLTGELIGSLGLAPSININLYQAMAQASHGSAPDIANKNIANPIGIMLSTSMLLNWLGNRHHDEKLKKSASAFEMAIYSMMSQGFVTPDLGGTETTTSFSDKLIEKIEQIGNK